MQMLVTWGRSGAIALLLGALAACGGDSPPAQSSDAGAFDDYAGTDEPIGDLESGAPPASTGAQASAGVRPVTLGSRVLSHPTARQITALAYRMRGETPPYEEIARNVRSIRGAQDEFRREELVAAEVARLQQAYADTEGVGGAVFTIEGPFSEYDAQAGGFTLSMFDPNPPVGVETPPGVSVVFDNAAAARVWRLNATDARAAFERNSRNRLIKVDVTVRLVGVERRGDETILHARIESYTVRSRADSVGQLGQQSVS